MKHMIYATHATQYCQINVAFSHICSVLMLKNNSNGSGQYILQENLKLHTLEMMY